MEAIDYWRVNYKAISVKYTYLGSENYATLANPYDVHRITTLGIIQTLQHFQTGADISDLIHATTG